MSTGLSGVSNSSTIQKVKDAHPKPILPYASYNQLASSSGTSSLSTFNGATVSNPLASLKKPVNNKRTPEELDIIQQTAERVRERLTQDQTAVSLPDVDSPFVDEMDVINRLLPYHLFQQPKDDLESLISIKGKEKAAADALHDEIQDTKFALECYRRRQKIIDRWRQALIKSGRRASPDVQSYYLAQVILEADRVENAFLGNELRTARAQTERIEREKRAAALASAGGSRISQFPSVPQVMMPTLQATPYYRAYPYGYAQPYGSAHPSVPISTVATFSAATAQTAPTLTTAPTTYSPYLPNGAIPVQLPVGSLPALHALGIVPVSAPPDGQGQAAAVLRGSTANGAILNLEINVSLLQSTQMTGLAMVLNSLVARTQTVAAATANAATSAVSNGSSSTPVKQPDTS